MMSVCTFSQESWPKWIQYRDSTNVLGFNEPQVDILGQKMILKDYLVGRNYELDKQVKDLQEQVISLKNANSLKGDEIAQLEYEVRISVGQAEQYKALYAEKKEEYNKYYSKYEKERSRKKVWRGTTFALSLVTGAFILLR